VDGLAAGLEEVGRRPGLAEERVPALAAVAGRETGPEAERLCRERKVLAFIGGAVVAGP